MTAKAAHSQSVVALLMSMFATVGFTLILCKGEVERAGWEKMSASPLRLCENGEGKYVRRLPWCCGLLD